MYFTTAAMDAHIAAVEAHDAACVAMDEDFPGWEDREQDPEDRRYVDASDVRDADAYAVRPMPGTAKGYALIAPQ